MKKLQLLLGAAACLMVVLPTQSAFAQKALKFNFFPPAKEPGFAKIFKPYLDQVTADSKGTVRVDSFPGGSLGRNPRQQFKLVADGVVDITWAIPAYSPGRFADRGLFELPGLFNDAMEASTTIWRMYARGKLKGFESIHPLMFGGVSQYLIHSPKPVKSLADLKGKKIRAGGPIHSATIKALGGVPIGIPITSAAESLSRGILDAASFEWFAAKAFRIMDVTSHHYEAVLGANYAVLVMDKKNFDGLPGDAKKAFTKHGGEKLARKFGGMHLKLNGMFRKMAEKSLKHTVIDPSGADVATLAKMRKSVIAGWLKSTPNGAQMLADARAILAEVRAKK
ncbi:MAG: TRAP transporter substrate-binding protein [Rhodospirillaceae bacterium]|jgi:TRAP-type transport system periplasmic protein|nr:TRAP transporter substrate-binding protein [Rhodospirillaceae bacterium]MBT4589690.1 TRAP transporter substrate-binding protein [Rhodospirillaceae bacterium]MBT7268056.1 TRAP transporter substrate-binding protein [Rhodospirillaceae bacterium]